MPGHAKFMTRHFALLIMQLVGCDASPAADKLPTNLYRPKSAFASLALKRVNKFPQTSLKLWHPILFCRPANSRRPASRHPLSLVAPPGDGAASPSDAVSIMWCTNDLKKRNVCAVLLPFNFDCNYLLMLSPAHRMLACGPDQARQDNRPGLALCAPFKPRMLHSAFFILRIRCLMQYLSSN